MLHGALYDAAGIDSSLMAMYKSVFGAFIE
jgi:hypothetical protein